MNYQKMIEDYLAGPAILRKAVAGMTREQLLARPIPGKWSTLEVVCHLADFEIVICRPDQAGYCRRRADDVRRRSENLFAARLAYHDRDLEEELTLVELIRKQVATNSRRH